MTYRRSIVISRSKIQSLKAIHNHDARFSPGQIIVISRSKIQSLKAIHNTLTCTDDHIKLLSVGQRYKV